MATADVEQVTVTTLDAHATPGRKASQMRCLVRVGAAALLFCVSGGAVAAAVIATSKARSGSDRRGTVYAAPPLASTTHSAPSMPYAMPMVSPSQQTPFPAPPQPSTTSTPPQPPQPPAPPPLPLNPGSCLGAPSPRCVYAPLVLAHRATQLNCVAAFQEGVADFGTRDSDWAEYDPRCVTVGEYTFNAAEPANALSSLSYDRIACDPSADERLQLAATLLGLGSFAMHASGGHQTTSALDTVPMDCVLTTLVHLLLAKTNTAQLVDIGGTLYDMERLANCSHEIADYVAACDLTPTGTGGRTSLSDQLQSIRNRLPTFGESLSMLIYGPLERCNGPGTADSIIGLVAGQFAVDTAQLPDVKLHLEGPHSTEACALITPTLSKFVEAASYQGTLGGANKRHDLWHETSSEALQMTWRLVDMWPSNAE